MSSTVRRGFVLITIKHWRVGKRDAISCNQVKLLNKIHEANRSATIR
jgi:hypothetical protein